ncbi:MULTISPECIES: hypothetical protein [unclassified Microcoleus]
MNAIADELEIEVMHVGALLLEREELKSAIGCIWFLNRAIA